MKHLVLIGFMGSGKSTFSSILSQAFRLPVFSTDAEIIQDLQMPISQIFEVLGEDFFRKEEARVFEKILQLKHLHIIDCGGGFGFYQDVGRLGEVVFLDLSLDEIVQRLGQEEREKRPLFSSKQEVQRIFAERREGYLKNSRMILRKTNQDAVMEISDVLLPELLQQCKHKSGS